MPPQLKTLFVSFNKDVQKHESELKGLTERYLDEKKEETEKKTTKRLLPVLKKYEEIVQSKQLSEPESAEDFSGGGGMRMDSKIFRDYSAHFLLG